MSIPTHKPKIGSAFITFDGDNSEAAYRALQSYTVIPQYNARGGRDRFGDINTNTSVRNSFDRDDYDYFRNNEKEPETFDEIMRFAQESYRRVGIIRNIIDLMGDFAVQGIRVVHDQPSIQRFYQKWWEQIGGAERSERFANLLSRLGNTAIRRGMAKVTAKERRKMSSKADNNMDADFKPAPPLSPAKYTIPYRYTFLNPRSLVAAGGDLGQFIGKQIYALKITPQLRQKIVAPKNDMEKAMVGQLPLPIVQAVRNGKRHIPLEPEKVSIYHYKKDDWNEWADPIVLSVCSDIQLLEKMKLADLAALDGAISQIRVWKLGDMEKGILPTDEAVEKLSDILMSNPGGGAFDLIWGPDLTVEEYKTSVHQFLGDAKYEPVLKSIYAAMGVPPTLTGDSGASGTTNNYVSLQTLLRRLEYIRKMLIRFWQHEFELVRKAMNFQKAARLEFDRMTLTDESAEKALLIQLWDRQLISDEIIVQRFGEIPELELARKVREERERRNLQRPGRVGPYVKAGDYYERLHEYVLTSLQRGFLDPRDVFIEVDEVPPFDRQLDLRKVDSGGSNDVKQTPKGKSGQGRPKNSKDSSPRKSRDFKPQNSAAEQTAEFITKSTWARDAQTAISEIITPGLLKHYNKKNLRQLSSKEFNAVEDIKFCILANFEMFSDINTESVREIVNSNPKLPMGYKELYSKMVDRITSNKQRNLNVEELRDIQASVHAMMEMNQ